MDFRVDALQWSESIGFLSLRMGTGPGVRVCEGFENCAFEAELGRMREWLVGASVACQYGIEWIGAVLLE